MTSPDPPRDKDRHRTSSRDRNRSRDHNRSSHKESRRRHSRSPTPPRTTGRSHRSSNRSRSRSTGRDREKSSKRTRRSRSRSTGRRRGESRDRDRELTRRNRAPLPSQQSSWAVTTGQDVPVEIEKPNYYPTGLLAAESNSVKQADGSVIRLKYSEPQEACKPTGRDADKWKLFVFRGGESEDTIPLGIRSSWLFGREKKVVDYPYEAVVLVDNTPYYNSANVKGKMNLASAGRRWGCMSLI